MDNAITINSKVFTTTARPTDTSTVRTTRSRGADLPDVFTASYKLTKNPVEPGSEDMRGLRRFDRTYINADGVVKQVSYMLQVVIPDDTPSGDITGVLADLVDFMTAGSGVGAANLAAIVNREI
jgi:hypothetical protein